jgi:hypothetical protein
MPEHAPGRHGIGARVRLRNTAAAPGRGAMLPRRAPDLNPATRACPGAGTPEQPARGLGGGDRRGQAKVSGTRSIRYGAAA